MKKMIRFIALALFSIVLAPAANAVTEVAKVNDKVITLEQVNARVAEQARSGTLTGLSRKSALDELIKREAAVQEAHKMKLENDPVIAERINNVLYYGLLEKKLGAEIEKITLSDAEAKNWYEKNPEIRTSHIFIALSPDATKDEEKKANEKLSQISSEIKSGKVSFAEAAQKNSEDPSAAMGGDLDYRMKDRLDPAFYRAALRLGKIGDISNIVRTPFGVHLIRLTGKHSWIEVDRTRVKRIILEDRRQELVNRFLSDLRQKAKVSVNEKLIKD
ncbi:MAG: peptidylprolyl isomerase [Bdellovibrionales bacterium]|nr:peptidylprolyl isomerase [Bdellovibrionales bacterium]